MSLYSYITRNDIDESEIAEVLEDLGCVVIHPDNIIDKEKIEHFKAVKNDYTLEQIEQLLPRK